MRKTLITLALFGTACGSSEPGEAPGLGTGPLYAVQHNLNAPDGRLVYVNLISSLDAPGDAILAEDAIEIEGYAAVQAFDGALFIAESDEKTITRWEFDAEGRPTPGDRVSFANEETGTFWNDDFLFLDASTAWYANTPGQEIIVWDPTAMQIKGKIPVTGLPSALPVTFHGLMRVGDRVFIPVTFANWDTYEAYPRVVVAVLSISEGRVIGVWEDDRCGMPSSVLPGRNVTADGTLYLLGDAFYGTWRHAGTPTAPPNCVLRILPDADGFDANWSMNLDNAVAGYGDVSTLLIDDANGRVYFDLMRQPNAPFATVDDLWDWQFAAGNTRRVGCAFPSFGSCDFVDTAVGGTMHWYTGKVDGRPLLTSLGRADNNTSEFGACSVYELTNQGPVKLFETTGFISQIIRVR